MNKIKEKKYIIMSVVSKYSFVLVFAFSLLIPFVVINATDTVSQISSSGIENPIKVNTLQEFIKTFIEGVLIVGIPLLVLAIIYAGFLYVKAQGNPGELEVAHRTLLYTIIGGALLLGAFVIANAIVGTVKEIESNV
jgi:hypothetical protein